MEDSNSPALYCDIAALTEGSPYDSNPSLSDTLDPDDHFGLAALLEQNGTPSTTARAFHIYSRLTKEQQHVDSMHRLGVLYRTGIPGIFKPRPLDAMMMFELVLIRKPENVPALEDLVDVVHHEFGRDERAKGIYRRILKIEPDHAAAKIGLATVLGHDSPSAKRLLMEVIEKEFGTHGNDRKGELEGKQKSKAVELLAQFFHRDGQAEEAEELLQRYGAENSTLSEGKRKAQSLGLGGLCKRLRAVDLDCSLTENDDNEKNKDMLKTGMNVT